MSSFTSSGYWWLPGDDEDPLGGTFTFSKREGGRLELLGTLRRDLKALFDPAGSYPTVHGTTTDGKDFTLVNCQVVHTRIGGGVSKEHLRPTMAVIGAHLENFEDMNFTTMTVRLSNLEDWLRRSGLRQDLPTRSSPAYKLTYTRPQRQTIRIPQGTVTIAFGWAANQTQFREATIREHAAVELHRSSGFTFRDATRDFVHPMQNLLTLCTLETCDVVDIRLQRRASSATPLQVCYQSSVEPPQRDKPLVPSDMLLPAYELRRDLPTLIRGWLVSHSAIKSVLNLYFAVMSGRWMFLESRFLTLAQAAEVFHRLTYPNTVVPKARHRQRIQAVVAGAPEDLRDWVQKALSFTNEPRLADRLETLVGRSSAFFDWDVAETQALATQTTRTRHYLTHYDPRAARRAASEERLYWLSEMLLFMVGALLLEHVGVPAKRIRSGVRNSQRFIFGRNRWRSVNSL